MQVLGPVLAVVVLVEVSVVVLVEVSVVVPVEVSVVALVAVAVAQGALRPASPPRCLARLPVTLQEMQKPGGVPIRCL